MRYEAHLERSFRRTLDLFLRLRAIGAAARAAEAAPAGEEPAGNQFVEAREARRELLGRMREMGVPESELAHHEAQLALEEREAEAEGG